jgi:elongation factor 1-alpha
MRTIPTVDCETLLTTARRPLLLSLRVFPPFSREERYTEIRDEMRHMLARVGWKPDFIEKSVPILPISGWMGDNLITKSEKMGWWKGMTVKTVDGRDVQVNCLLDVSYNAVGL